jgi:phosphatidylserine/phosphatidylglycerophosphate/cardiolipin synthase-like enzyme
MNYELINTADTFSRLLTLIREAKEHVTLISPYVTLGADDHLGRAIREALARKVRVSVVVRVDDQTPLKESWLEAIRPHCEAGLNLFAVRGLHAKIYWSESTVIITSLNLLASSVLNTIEVGLWSQEPKAVAEAKRFINTEIVPHVQRLIFQGKPSPRAPRAPPARTRQPSQRKGQGHCIRCGDDITLNTSRPYCRDDYEEWAEWENEDYEDKYCHGCGDDFPATMRKPLCRKCYRQFA